jgi:hypothetical protein
VQERTCSNAMVTRYQADTRHPADSFAFAQDRLGAAVGPRLCRPQVDIHIEVPQVEATLRVGEKLSDNRLLHSSIANNTCGLSLTALPAGRGCNPHLRQGDPIHP